MPWLLAITQTVSGKSCRHLNLPGPFYAAPLPAVTPVPTEPSSWDPLTFSTTARMSHTGTLHQLHKDSGSVFSLRGTFDPHIKSQRTNLALCSVQEVSQPQGSPTFLNSGGGGSALYNEDLPPAPSHALLCTNVMCSSLSGLCCAVFSPGLSWLPSADNSNGWLPMSSAIPDGSSGLSLSRGPWKSSSAA